MRAMTVRRKTSETDIELSINIDGEGKSDIESGIGFFDHMLTLFAAHGCVDLSLRANGDLLVDGHHTVEDIGITLGDAINEILTDRAGINRYGTFYLPMDEALAFVSLDISGRPYLVFSCEFTRDSIGMMASEMVEEFMRAFAFNAGITLHVNLHYGKNDHHKAEAVFKALGHALKIAMKVTGDGVASTKGMLE